MKLGKQVGEKNSLLEMIEKKNIANNLANLQNKEQNLKNINKINDE